MVRSTGGCGPLSPPGDLGRGDGSAKAVYAAPRFLLDGQVVRRPGVGSVHLPWTRPLSLTPPWMLVAGAHGDRAAGSRLRKRPVLLAVARRGLPNLVEATLVPAILFFVIVATIGAGIAMAAVLTWAYVAVLRRVLRGDAGPGDPCARDRRPHREDVGRAREREHLRVLPPADRDHRRARRASSSARC